MCDCAKKHKYQGPDDNPYLPYLARVISVTLETPNIKSFQVVLDDKEKMSQFSFEPGQVAQLSLFGVGESTFVINSAPHTKDYLQFTIMRAGEVTSAFHDLSVGAQIGIRAPLGNWFPCQEMEGRNIVFVGGGLGLAPLRTLILHMLAHREKYKDIHIIYGSRTPNDLCYSKDLADWQRRGDIHVTLTIDREVPGWEYKVGFVPVVVGEAKLNPENAVAITCGPPIMIKFVLIELEKAGFKPEQIYTTLERRMKCGLGLCGRCNIGPKYVCIDGPVFTFAQLKALPDEL
ncbi:MAG: FAD/NAD(P)-binding protein [Candidatus Schekmanbacteria bacterium]|nr:FAD/NAD(P)-binding protein [Candidatus Schekmanbacteria bacterium]